MADFHFVIFLMSFITANVLACNQEFLELRLQAALEQSKAESEARFRALEMKLNAKENELEKTRTDLEETRSDLQHTIIGLKETRSDLQNTKSDLQKTKSDLQETMNNLQKANREVECSKSSSRDKRVSEPEPVAFHAELGTSATNLVANTKFIFELPLVNSGHAYNNQTGIFTCPQSGVYFFSLSILSFPGEQVETELVVNGDDGDIMQTYSGSSSSSRYDSGSRSVVWKLNTGDRVWPRLYNNIGINGVSSKIFGGPWSTFTGFLVHAT